MVVLIIVLVVLYVFSIGATKALLDNLAAINNLMNDLYRVNSPHTLKVKKEVTKMWLSIISPLTLILLLMLYIMIIGYKLMNKVFKLIK